MLKSSLPRTGKRRNLKAQQRQGVVAVLAAVLLVIMFGFVAFGIDTGRMSLTKTQLQNAVDAAALAASQEINLAISESGEAQEGVDINDYVLGRARDIAVEVAAANGVFIDRNRDVRFGNRSFDDETETWPILWDVEPYNVVQVSARRDNVDTSQPDGRLKLAFGWAVGKDSIELSGKGTAFVESRDMVQILDFSGSMNYDSQLRAFDSLGQVAVEDNMEDIWNALGPPAAGSLPFTPQYLTLENADPSDSTQPKIYVTFEGGRAISVAADKALTEVTLYFTNNSSYRFSNLNQGGTGTFSYNNREIYACYVKCGSSHIGDGSGNGDLFIDNVDAVKQAFGLDSVSYPYSSGSWNSVIDHCRNDSNVRDAGYQKMYGGLLMVDYLLDNKQRSYQTYDLYNTPHYPFHAVKNGTSLLLEHLNALDIGDEIGLVTYDSSARVEHSLNEADVNVSLGSDWISSNYETIDLIQRHKQAGHYDIYTGIGYGVESARWLLENHKRPGAHSTIILMTDGNANRSPSSFSLPGDWDWADYTDYDDDGSADYSTTNRHKQHAIYQAKLAIDEGATIHTISVGAGADRSLMKAIAFMGNGLWVDVPGGNSVAIMEEQMNAAFSEIAAKIPPPRLITE